MTTATAPEATTPTLPWSAEAEAGLLSSLFHRPEAVDETRALLSPSDWFRRSHRSVWEAMVRVSESGGALDVVTVTESLRSAGELESAGGLEYLAEIVDVSPGGHMADRYARIIRDKARLRRLIRVCEEAAHEARSGPEDVEAVFGDTEQRLLEARGVVADGACTPIKDALWGALHLIEQEAEAKGGVTGIPSGIPTLDHRTSGMQPGGVTVLAGRPGMGKTSMALTMSMAASSARHPTAVFSLEMSKDEMVKRMLAMRADLNLLAIRRGQLTDRDYAAIGDASAWLNLLPLYLDDTTTGRVHDIRGKARRLKSRSGLGLLVVDYLQLMQADGRGRTEQVTNISRGLKLLARELDCHVLALSQLNRGVESRQPPRPALSDLRDSGAIEQDADVVLMLWRPEYYFTDRTSDESRAKWQGRGELIIAKQRNGPTGTVGLQWDAGSTRFTEEARNDGRVAA